ncbi:MAG: hypothetical protein AAGI30_10410 [Planctomycetota bacterium]
MDPKTPPPNQPGSAPPDGAQIGAGLQESRLNTEFIDFLKKYGGFAIYAVAAVVVAYAAWGYIQDQRLARLDSAFADLDGATDSPAVLRQVAADQLGHGAVGELAMLQLGESLLNEARVGIVGAVGLTNVQPEDYLEADERTEKVQEALELFQDVRATVGANSAQTALQLRAIWGVASAQLSLQQFDEAEETLTRFVDLASQGEIEPWAELGELRLESLGMLRIVDPIEVVIPEPVTDIEPVTEAQAPASDPAPAPNDQGDAFSPIDTTTLPEVEPQPEPESPADDIGPPDPPAAP